MHHCFLCNRPSAPPCLHGRELCGPLWSALVSPFLLGLVVPWTQPHAPSDVDRCMVQEDTILDNVKYGYPSRAIHSDPNAGIPRASSALRTITQSRPRLLFPCPQVALHCECPLRLIFLPLRAQLPHRLLSHMRCGPTSYIVSNPLRPQLQTAT